MPAVRADRQPDDGRDLCGFPEAGAASKSAVETFTRIAAREFGPLGVTCNAVGPTPYDLLRGVADAPLEELIKRQAIQRWATAQE